MNNEYLERAKMALIEKKGGLQDNMDIRKLLDAKELIILASKRARQLAYGARPMVRCKEDNFIDVALLEIAEGQLEAIQGTEESDFLKEARSLKEAAARNEKGKDAFAG